MLLYLVIAAIVSINILLLFSSTIDEHFPNIITSSITSFKQDINSMVVQSLESAAQNISSLSQNIPAQLPEIRDDTLEMASQTLGHAKDQLHSTSDKIREDLTGLGDMSADLVEQNVAEMLESVP